MFSCAKLTLHFLFDKNIVFKFNYNPYSSDEPNIENSNNSTLRGIVFLEAHVLHLWKWKTLNFDSDKIILNVVLSYRESQKTWDMPISLLQLCDLINKLSQRLKSSINSRSITVTKNVALATCVVHFFNYASFLLQWLQQSTRVNMWKIRKLTTIVLAIASYGINGAN